MSLQVLNNKVPRKDNLKSFISLLVVNIIDMFGFAWFLPLLSFHHHHHHHNNNNNNNNDNNNNSNNNNNNNNNN